MSKSRIHSSSPDAYVLFFPYRKEDTKVGARFDPESLKTEPVILQNEILSLSTSKPKGRDGEWSMVLSAGQNYKSMLHPGCWCLIYISDQPLAESYHPSSNPTSGLKMLGIVKSVRAIESLNESTGARTLRYEVHGTDFNSVLNTQVYINEMLGVQGTPQTEVIKNNALLFRGIAFDSEVKPDRMISLLIDSILGKNVELSSETNASVGGLVSIPTPVSEILSGQKNIQKFVSVLNKKFYDKFVGIICPQPSLSSEFSLWSMLLSYSHPILNELYSELLPETVNGKTRLRPSLVFRPIPFSSKKTAGKLSASSSESADQLGAMPVLSITDGMVTKDRLGIGLYLSKEIDEAEILSMNYGKSDSERFNFFYVSPNTSSGLGAGSRTFNELVGGKDGMSALGDVNSITRNGLRPFISVSAYINTKDSDIVATNEIVRDMWAKAHLYENGVITLIGQGEHIPVGTNILFKERGWIAHVEQVSHTYFVDPARGLKTFKTTLTFVRLQTKDGLPTDSVEGNGNGQRGDFDRGITVVRNK